MTITRRDALKTGAGAALAAATAGRSRALFAQSAQFNLKTIPSSGQQIVPIGIGTNRYGNSPRDELRDTMERFVELGGQVMDTAAIYGESEAVIGDLATDLGIQDDLFVATKTDIRGQVRGEEGLQLGFDKLQRDVIETFLVHNFANIDTELPIMREWQDEGRIRYIGASTSSTSDHGRMEQLLENEEVQMIQVNYSLGDRASADRILPLAADRGVGVMINVPFGGGGNNSLFDSVSGMDVPEWAADFDAASWGQFFLKYIISHPAVTVAIPGTTQVRHVVDNVGAAMGRLPDAAQRRRQEQFFDSL